MEMSDATDLGRRRTGRRDARVTCTQCGCDGPYDSQSAEWWVGVDPERQDMYLCEDCRRELHYCDRCQAFHSNDRASDHSAYSLCVDCGHVFAAHQAYIGPCEGCLPDGPYVMNWRTSVRIPRTVCA